MQDAQISLKPVRAGQEPESRTFLSLGREYLAEIDPRNQARHEAFLRSVLRRTGEANRWLELILVGQEPVGFCHAKLEHRGNQVEGCVMEFFILRGWRRKGVGRAAVTLILDRIWKQGARTTVLFTNPSAEPFWRACRFEDSGELEAGQKRMLAHIPA